MIDALLRRQHGLVTRRQALAAGLTTHQIDHRVATRRWLVVARGLYRAATAAVTFEQRTLAAVLASGGVASHRAAAVLLGLDPYRSAPVEVTVPIGRRGGSRLAIVNRTRHLDRVDVAVAHDVPCTRVARTIVDLATVLDDEDALAAVVDAALVDGRTSRRGIEAAAARAGLGRSGRAGAATVAAVLDAWTPGRPPGSRREIILVRRLRAAGLPDPVRQFDVHDDDGTFVARPDLSFPHLRIAIEYQSERFHTAPRSRARDEARRNRLTALGWIVFADAPGIDVVPAVLGACRARAAARGQRR